jgi:16S rRNA (cytosine1402-N4)-methyltransferase
VDHYPVMLPQVLEYLGIRPEGTYLDVTAGLGGHTGAIAQRLTSGLVIAADRDGESLETAKRNTEAWQDRIRYAHAAFSEAGQVVAGNGMTQVDGLIADLGVSRYQLTDSQRGFSLMTEGPLDMRMDRSQESTAADIVNYTAEKALADLIFGLGEERRAFRIARAIVRARPIRSTLHLARVVEQVAPRHGRLHPATQTFMALRLAVNGELEELDALLEQGPQLVKPGGRVVVITFMSLEDRKVKQSFQGLAREGRGVVLTKHVVRPEENEIRENPASRSAKLRAWQRVEESGAGRDEASRPAEA